MKKSKAKDKQKDVMPALPQNIVRIGERVYDDKNIYIHQKTYAKIHKFASNKTENEHGGILVGRTVNEMGKENTIIEEFIEAKYNTATPTTLTFTHETWDYFHEQLNKKYKDKKIVGWIHTHPNFGIFLSENDRFIQQNFFTDTNQVAYVVDPIQNDEGFFFWVDGKLERCPGFYIFDKNGVKIEQKFEFDETKNDSVPAPKKSVFSTVLTILLTIAFIANTCLLFRQNERIRALEKQVDDQNVVLRYGAFGGIVPEISVVADDIREKLRMQQQAAQNNANQQDNQAENAEKAPQNEKADAENTNGGVKNNGLHR